MPDADLRHLAVIIVLYALFEFLVKRLVWRPVQTPSFSALLGEACMLMAILTVGTMGFVSWTLCGGFLVVVVVRALGARFVFRQRQYRSLEKFLILQSAVFVLFVVAWRIAQPLVVHEWYTYTEATVIAHLGRPGAYLQRSPTLVLVVLSLYLFMVDGGARLVRGTLDKFPILMDHVAAAAGVNGENRGEWIGVLERIITLTFVLTGNYTAVAFALTAKSIARFKELDNKDFAEYYLLGTSTSVAIALLAGSLIRLFL